MEYEYYVHFDKPQEVSFLGRGVRRVKTLGPYPNGHVARRKLRLIADDKGRVRRITRSGD